MRVRACESVADVLSDIVVPIDAIVDVPFLLESFVPTEVVVPLECAPALCIFDQIKQVIIRLCREREEGCDQFGTELGEAAFESVLYLAEMPHHVRSVRSPSI